MFNAENLQVYLKKDLGVSPKNPDQLSWSGNFLWKSANAAASIFAVP